MPLRRFRWTSEGFATLDTQVSTVFISNHSQTLDSDRYVRGRCHNYIYINDGFGS
jgi:hypothetical protein